MPNTHFKSPIQLSLPSLFTSLKFLFAQRVVGYCNKENSCLWGRWQSQLIFSLNSLELIMAYINFVNFSPLPAEKFEMDPIVVHTIKLMQHAKKLRNMISNIQQQQDGMVRYNLIFLWSLTLQAYLECGLFTQQVYKCVAWG